MLVERQLRTPDRGNGTSRGLLGKLRKLAAGYAQQARCEIAIWQKRRRIEEELASLDDRALADLGLMRCQAAALAAAFPATSQQLGQVLARLRLSTEDGSLDCLTYNDLYRTCAMCVKRSRCRNWLASAKGSEGFPSFCPNGCMFRRLLEIRSLERRQGLASS